ncbi:hypothetical protein [uncultured Xylophilus sp.]|uniref:hypothetical protein n=1 Tax=uncultured Xylophilus sp. TaxID=296832 RepID=UPI0025D93B01|nr:hypothetical protein [uncultured Xylophilus sp.]
MSPRILVLPFLVLLLTGCEIPGVWPDPKIAQREADSKAIGGACRHAQRGIEDCYTLNPKAAKAAVFTGWKDMDQYMRENKIAGAPATLAPGAQPAAATVEVDASLDRATEKVLNAAGSKPRKVAPL